MAREHAPPAKPWYDLVVATIALQGGTKAELSERAGVARTTIDNWERNPRKPQAKSVNAVADALGIPRERALVLAGIIPGAPGPPAEAKVPPELEGYQELVDQIRDVHPRPEDQALMLDTIAAWLRGDPPPIPPAAGRSQSGERERRAG